MTKINRVKLKLFKTNLKLLTDYAFEFDYKSVITERIYTDEDLLYATCILMHTLWNIAISKGLDKWLSEKTIMIVSEQMWAELRKFIKTYADLDTMKLADKYMKWEK